MSFVCEHSYFPATCRADVTLRHALLGPQAQQITIGLKQPLFLAIVKKHSDLAQTFWRDHSLQKLQRVHLQVGPQLCIIWLWQLEGTLMYALATLSDRSVRVQESNQGTGA